MLKVCIHFSLQSKGTLNINKLLLTPSIAKDKALVENALPYKSPNALDDQLLKDQGYTRAKVLILVPFRNSCYKIVKLLLELLPAKAKVDNYERLLEEYGPDDEEEEIMAKYLKSSYSKSPNEMDFAKGSHPELQQYKKVGIL